MVTKTLPIDIEAFGALDHRRLLRVLRRAIDEETAEMMSRGRIGVSARDRERLECLCTLVGMVQRTIVIKLCI